MKHTLLPVVRVKNYSKDVFEIVLERKGISFKPGDCLALHGPNNEKRPYSIASNPSDPQLHFFIRRMGLVSNWLGELHTKNFIRVDFEPFGYFRPGECPKETSFNFIATGTGIAPFMAYLTDPDQNRFPTKIVWGLRHIEDGINLPWIVNQFDNVHIAISTDEKNKVEEHPALKNHIDKFTFNCHIQDILPTIYTTNEKMKDEHFYLCGLADMITDVSCQLVDMDVNPANIKQEFFYFPTI